MSPTFCLQSVSLYPIPYAPFSAGLSLGTVVECQDQHLAAGAEGADWVPWEVRTEIAAVFMLAQLSLHVIIFHFLCICTRCKIYTLPFCLMNVQLIIRLTLQVINLVKECPFCKKLTLHMGTLEAG